MINLKNKIIKNFIPYNYELLKIDLILLKNKYDNFYIGTIGDSVLGENIKYLKIGNGKKKVFINANICFTEF